MHHWLVFYFITMGFAAQLWAHGSGKHAGVICVPEYHGGDVEVAIIKNQAILGPASFLSRQTAWILLHLGGNLMLTILYRPVLMKRWFARNKPSLTNEGTSFHKGWQLQSSAPLASDRILFQIQTYGPNFLCSGPDLTFHFFPCLTLHSIL